MMPPPAYREELVARIRRLSAPMHPLPVEEAGASVPDLGCRAVLFDVYGTLMISGSGDIGVATATDHQQALEESLAAAGIEADVDVSHVRPLIEAEHQRKRMSGIAFPEVDILAMWRSLLADVEVDEQQWQILAVEYEVRTNPTWPMPDLELLLSSLRARDLPLGIVSNAQFYTPLLFEAYLGLSLEALGFDPEACVWSYQVGEAKPSIRLFEIALQQFQRRWRIPATEVLYVGNDRRNDIWPAHQAGCRTALFAGDRRSLRRREADADLAGLAADMEIQLLREVLGAVRL